MKTQLPKAFVLGCLMISGFAYAQSAAQTTSEINAQATITRGAIDNVIARMSEERSHSGFRAEDYRAQSKDLKNRIERALLAFEDTLTKEIFPKAAFWMDQYNAVYNSTEFSEQQKKILLEQRYNNVVKQFELLSKDYNKAVRKLYSFVPHYDIRFVSKEEKINLRRERSFEGNFVVGGKPTGKKVHFIFETDDREISEYTDFRIKSEGKVLQNAPYPGNIPGVVMKADYWSPDAKFDLKVAEFIPSFVKTNSLVGKDQYSLMYKGIKGDCRSAICIGLRSSDLIDLLANIQEKMDRTIKMKLASGQEVNLVWTGLNLNLIKALLARTDYPESLPFDI